MKLLFTPHANEEVVSAIAYYNDKQKGLGKRFAYELQVAVSYMLSWPNKSEIRYKNVRAAIVKNFPFLVFYSFNTENKTILVLSVFNTYQNPTKNKRSIKKK